jgi:hypothetical protein
MSTLEMRTAVHQMIDEVDNVLLEAIHSMLETYRNRLIEDPIVGYEIDGTPITASLLESQAELAMEQVEQGEYITLEQLEQELELWQAHTQ